MGVGGVLVTAVQTVGGGVCRLVARGSADGRVRWSTDVHNCLPVRGVQPLLHSGDPLLYIHTRGVTAFDASRGTFLWGQLIPETRVPGVVVAPDCVVIAHAEGHIGVHPSTGRARWRRRQGAHPVPTGFRVAEAPGLVHLSVDGLLDALETSTGATRWLHRLDDKAMAPVTAGGLVLSGGYSSAHGGDVVTALDAQTGVVAWQRLIVRDAEPDCRLQLLGFRSGLLYVKSARGGRHRLTRKPKLPFLAALDIATGALRWRWEHPDIDTRPALLHRASVVVQLPVPTAVALPSA
ncbi:PQQ-binding-like beta-propeller repeat protein [Streptomyces niveus]|uniref:outer membrane protein assembly factor BamB family protein n=1 Tax=Streptomyces niveus TaxID=193462 RepID=UPI0036AC5548